MGKCYHYKDARTDAGHQIMEKSQMAFSHVI
jgi:hypothetical protein